MTGVLIRRTGGDGDRSQGDASTSQGVLRMAGHPPKLAEAGAILPYSYKGSVGCQHLDYRLVAPELRDRFLLF